LSLVIVIFSDFPDVLSKALTFKIPSALISNVTSTCGTPRGAGGYQINQISQAYYYL